MNKRLQRYKSRDTSAHTSWYSPGAGKYWKRQLHKARRRYWKDERHMRGLARYESTVNWRND